MKSKIIILLLSIINTFYVFAGDIEPRDLKLFREGEKIVLSFSAYIPEKTVHADRRLLVTPQLYNDNGAALMETFSVTGKRMERKEKQKSLLAGRSAGDNSIANGSNGSTMFYVASILYESWMENELFLLLKVEEEGCCTREDIGAMTAMGPLDLPLPYQPSLPEVAALPSDVTQKVVEYPFLRLIDLDGSGDRSTSVRFKTASSELDMSFSSNRENVKKIANGIDLVNSDLRTRLEKITIVGFASPEGDKQLNMRLAENRAKALSQYLQQEMGIPAETFEVQSGGEDWDGLLELVRKSDMQYKDEIINIITNYPVDTRNDRLKQIGGGRPYRSIYDVLYPQLRDACYINVWYSEKEDEAAITINNAIALIASLRYDEALRSLSVVEGDSRSWNVIGTCYLLLGDYKEARIWLGKAVAAGDKEAEKNIELIK